MPLNSKNGHTPDLTITLFSAPSEHQVQFDSESVIKSFLDINLERDDFQYLKGLNHEHGIPVFYIAERGFVTQMGMAQMFRFPYKYSVGQLRHDSHLDENETRKDFAELLFGDITEGKQSSKGRVSFSLAKCTETQVTPMQLKPTVLGSPRNSFYPAYIDQSKAKNGYKTYNQKDAKLAGYKRYAIRKEFKESTLQDPPQVPSKENQINFKVAVQLRPLPQKTTFTGKVRFHNLTPQELGALIFALNLDQNAEQHFHHIGMGKPLGFGKVKFSNLSVKLNTTDRPALPELMKPFQNYINHTIQSGKTITQLLMNQSEATFNDADLKYPAFPEGFINTVKTKGQAKLIDLASRAEALQKQQEELRQKQLRQLREAQKLAELNQASNVEKLIEDEFNSTLDKAAFNKLSENPELWSNLSDSEQEELKTKILICDYYKGLNTKSRKKIPQKLEAVGIEL